MRTHLRCKMVKGCWFRSVWWQVADISQHSEKQSEWMLCYLSCRNQDAAFAASSNVWLLLNSAWSEIKGLSPHVAPNHHALRFLFPCSEAFPTPKLPWEVTEISHAADLENANSVVSSMIKHRFEHIKFNPLGWLHTRRLTSPLTDFENVTFKQRKPLNAHVEDLSRTQNLTPAAHRYQTWLQFFTHLGKKKCFKNVYVKKIYKTIQL